MVHRHRFCFLCKYLFKLNDKALLVICSEEEIRFYVATFIDLFKFFVRSEVAHIGNWVNMIFCIDSGLHSVQLHHSFCSVMLCPTSFSRSIWVTNACALKRMNGFETRKTSLSEPFFERRFFCLPEWASVYVFVKNKLFVEKPNPRDNLEFVFVINKF